MSERDKSPTRRVASTEELMTKQIQGKIGEYQTLVKRLNGRPIPSRCYLDRDSEELQMEFGHVLELRADGIDGGSLGLGMKVEPSQLLEMIGKFSQEHQCEALERLKKNLDDETESILRAEIILTNIDDNWLKLSQSEKPPVAFFPDTLGLSDLYITTRYKVGMQLHSSLYFIDTILSTFVAARK